MQHANVPLFPINGANGNAGVADIVEGLFVNSINTFHLARSTL